MERSFAFSLSSASAAWPTACGLMATKETISLSFELRPPTIARTPTFAMSPRRSGASEPIPPTWIAMLEKFAKPQSA